MLKAYFDDSGTHVGAPIVVVGGLIGTDAQWKGFDANWRARLKCPIEGKQPLKKFGMHDCQESIGDFKGYSRTESDFVMHEFRQIIKNSGIVGYSSAIDKVAWDELVTAERRQNMGPAENFCLTRCARNMLANAKDHFTEKTIRFTYDEGRKAILSNRIERFEWTRGLIDCPQVASFTYAKVRDLTPLQGADMLATESYWLLKKRRSNKTAEPRSHFQDYVKSAKGFGDFMSREVLLKELAARYPDGTVKSTFAR